MNLNLVSGILGTSDLDLLGQLLDKGDDLIEASRVADSETELARDQILASIDRDIRELVAHSVDELAWHDAQDLSVVHDLVLEDQIGQFDVSGSRDVDWHVGLNWALNDLMWTSAVEKLLGQDTVDLLMSWGNMRSDSIYVSLSTNAAKCGTAEHTQTAKTTERAQANAAEETSAEKAESAQAQSQTSQAQASQAQAELSRSH